MTYAFEKYHGTANDFIILDIRNHAIPDDPDIISQLCDRHTGIGADGVIFLEDSALYDFKMRYFNADGNEGSMCGNGGRCISAFAHKHCLISDNTTFEAIDGKHHAEILEINGDEYLVRLDMRDVRPAKWEDGSIFLDTGSPHLVKQCKNLSSCDVVSEGREIRYSARFSPGGTNVNFIELVDGVLHVRTYERGVENETLSCGTGVAAAAISQAIGYGAESPLEVKTLGGMLKVSFKKTDREFTDIKLEGAAKFVFSGQIEI